MRRHLIHLLLACLVWLVALPALGESGVHLILSEAGGAYQEAADAFRSGIGMRRSVRVWNLADMSAAQVQTLTRGSDLLVPVGVKAARYVAEQHGGKAPVLALMLPRAAAERIRWPAALGRGKTTSVFIDQPASRTLGLVEEAFPGARRVGVVISEENQGTVKFLAQEAAKRRLELKQETVAAAEDVAPALRRLLPDSDVLLLVPDTLAINSANAQNVLLTTYRYRVPVVGFSQGLAKAGAVAAVYSSPAQIGRQGAQIATRWFVDEGELPPPQPASEFSVAFNSRVARSLGLSMADEGEIRRRLGAQDE